MAIPIDPAAVLAWGGKTSGRTTHAIGARPILKEIANEMMAIPDKIDVWVLRPNARTKEKIAVPAAESISQCLFDTRYNVSMIKAMQYALLVASPVEN